MAGLSTKPTTGLSAKGNKRKLSEASATSTSTRAKKKSKSTKGHAKVPNPTPVEASVGRREASVGNETDDGVIVSGTPGTEDAGDETVELEERPAPPAVAEPMTTEATASPLSNPLNALPNTSTSTSTSTSTLVPVPPLFTPHAYHRLLPPKPSSSTLPLPFSSPTGRPRGATTTGPARQVKRRDVIYVTKNTGLGSYLRRCKGLLVEEGHREIHLHALSAAIPHALLVLHSLLDILPFPKKHVSHELKSSSVRCFDERRGTGGKVRSGPSGAKEGVEGEEGGEKGEDKGEWEPVLFDDEEPEGAVRVRIKSALEIIIKIGPAAQPRPTTQDAQKRKRQEDDILRSVQTEPAPKKVAFAPSAGVAGGPEAGTGMGGKTDLRTAVWVTGAETPTEAWVVGQSPMVVDEPLPGKAGTRSTAAVVGIRPPEAGGRPETKKKNRPSKAKRMALRKTAAAAKAQGEGEIQGTGGEGGGDGGDEEEMMNMA